MRKFLLLLAFGIAQLAAAAQDEKISLTLAKSPLSNLFKQIEIQSGYTFIYSDEVVSDTMLVTVHESHTSVSYVLQQVLPGKQLFYQLLSGRMIAIGSTKLRHKVDDNSVKTLLHGLITHPDGHPIPFATITLLENELQVNGAIGNEKGEFRLSYAFKTNKSYLLKISSLGYEISKVGYSFSNDTSPQYNIGNVILQPVAKELKQVDINGSPKVIEMDGSNIVFNVAKSMNAQGSNALELLSRAPGVTVSSDNSISLNGKAGAAVLIDGKQTYLSSREVAELLKSMSSSDIRSIEIIASPGAKYDAAGTAGIINVKTLKSNIQGFNGSLTSGLSYGVYLRNNQDLSLSYRKNKLNLYGNYSHFIGHYSYLYGADRIQEGKFYNSFTDDVDKRNKMGSRIGADYAIDKNQTVGLLLNGNFLFGGGITDTRTEIGTAETKRTDQVLTAINDYYHQQTDRYNVNINYKYEDTLGHLINIDADYGDFSKVSGNLQSNTYSAANNAVLRDNLYRSINAIDIGLWAVKIDYASNFLKGKVETGLKYSSVSTDNDAKFLEIQPAEELLDPTRSNRFVYDEKIASAYLNYRKDLGKWQFQGGLRVENSISKGSLDKASAISGNKEVTDRNYTNLFPFFSVNVKTSAVHSFSASYSRRIDRPAYQNLNPFIYLLDELSFWQGNPFLQPQLSHRALLQYAYKSATIVGLTYTRTDNFSVEVTDTIDLTKIVMVPRNLGTQKHLALSFTQTLNPHPWWNITLNGTLFGLYNNIDFGSGRTLKLRKGASRFSLQQNFKLPHKFSAELTGFYNSRRLVGANQFPNATSQLDLGLQRNFLDNKANLRLVFADVYKGSKTTSIQSVPGLYIRNYSYFETRQIKLNFSYRFNSGNSKGPRTRSSALENENGRIK